MNNNIFPLICFVITLMQNLNIMNVFLCIVYCVLKKKKLGEVFFHALLRRQMLALKYRISAIRDVY